MKFGWMMNESPGMLRPRLALCVKDFVLNNMTITLGFDQATIYFYQMIQVSELEWMTVI